MATELTRDEVDATRGPMVLEFGASWCGICQGARPLVERARGAWPDVPYQWIEDGKGQRLGRSFGVKLWPTLVFLRDGQEVTRVVRPRSDDDLRAAYAQLTAPPRDAESPPA